MVGFSVDLPEGWRHVADKPYYYVLEGPNGRIRAHLYDSESKTPEEALKYSVSVEDRFNAQRPRKTVLLSSEPFVTASGIPGITGAFGAKGDKATTTLKNFLPNSKGRMVCFCIDNCDQPSFIIIQRALLTSLKHIPPDA